MTASAGPAGLPQGPDGQSHHANKEQQDDKFSRGHISHLISLYHCAAAATERRRPDGASPWYPLRSSR